MGVAKTCIVIGGILSLCLTVYHIRFYQFFDWERDFERIRYRNRLILYTIHVALFLLFFGLSLLSFAYADELSRATGLGFGLTLVLSLFWLWRTIWQIVYFRPPKDSPVQRLPLLHYVMIVVFVFLTAVYFAPIGLKLLP